MSFFKRATPEDLQDPPQLVFPVDLDIYPGGEVYSGNKRLPRIGEVLGMNDFTIDTARTIIRQINHAKVFEDYNGRETQAYLFAGPPGSGKSMLTRAIPRETAENIFLYRINAGKLSDARTGGLRTNLDFVYRKISILAQAQTAEEKQRRSRKKPKKTIVVVMDEFDSVALKKVGGEVNLDYDQFGAVNDFLTQFDQLQETTSNVIFLLTTNYPELMEGAVIDRMELVKFYQPNATTRKHMIIQHLSNRMFGMKDEKDVFDSELVQAILLYRNASESLSNALKSGSQKDIKAAKIALAKVYTREVEELLRPAVLASEGFSGRDIQRAIYSLVKGWIGEKAETDAERKFLRRDRGPSRIGKEKLAYSMHERGIQKIRETQLGDMESDALEREM